MTLLLASIIPIYIAFFSNISPIRSKKLVTISTVVLSSIPFILWDIYATQMGHWGFNKNYNLGIYIFNLPIEEYLFFILIPINCIFIWTILKKYNNFPEFLEGLKKLKI